MQCNVIQQYRRNLPNPVHIMLPHSAVVLVRTWDMDFTYLFGYCSVGDGWSTGSYVWDVGGDGQTGWMGSLGESTC